LSSHQEKILVVDDETSIRRILETRLSMIGYDVVTAADGEEALDTFRKADPNLVVLDVMMPKLDGYGVCQNYVRNRRPYHYANSWGCGGPNHWAGARC